MTDRIPEKRNVAVRTADSLVSCGVLGGAALVFGLAILYDMVTKGTPMVIEKIKNFRKRVKITK